MNPSKASVPAALETNHGSGMSPQDPDHDQARQTRTDEKPPSVPPKSLAIPEASTSNSPVKLPATLRKPNNAHNSGWSLSKVASTVSSAWSAEPDPAKPAVDVRKQPAPRHLTFDEVVQMYRDQKRRGDEAEHRVQELKTELDRIRTVNNNLQHQIEDQDSAVRKAQESVFAVMATTGPRAEDDDIVRGKLKIVTSQWKPFAKAWAIRSVSEIKDEATPEWKIFADLVVPDEVNARDGIWEPENDAKAPSILLNAELARFIDKEIIRQPFIAIKGLTVPQQKGSIDLSTEPSTFQTIYERTKKDDPAAANLWRSQTVSFIDPPDYYRGPYNRKRKEEAVKRKNDYYRQLVNKFENSRAKVLFRECNGEETRQRQDHLFDIFQESGSLFSGLWSQKVEIDTLGLADLRKTPFQAGHFLLGAHATHKLEEGETSMDGMHVQMVVQPAIIARGDERSEGYDSFKVWAKAVVWLSSGGLSTSKK